jgi:RNase P/RNase MRP subunit POP5
MGERLNPLCIMDLSKRIHQQETVIEGITLDGEELSRLLLQSCEGYLGDNGRASLDALMQTYRRGLVRKSQAWKVAVARGLRAALT